MYRTLKQVIQDIDEKMKLTENDFFKKMLQKTRYAMSSMSRDLVYEQIGYYQMAYELKAITREEAEFMRKVLIYDGLNNSAITLE